MKFAANTTLPVNASIEELRQHLGLPDTVTDEDVKFLASAILQATKSDTLPTGLSKPIPEESEEENEEENEDENEDEEFDGDEVSAPLLEYAFAKEEVPPGTLLFEVEFRGVQRVQAYGTTEAEAVEAAQQMLDRLQFEVEVGTITQRPLEEA